MNEAVQTLTGLPFLLNYFQFLFSSITKFHQENSLGGRGFIWNKKNAFHPPLASNCGTHIARIEHCCHVTGAAPLPCEHHVKKGEEENTKQYNGLHPASSQDIPCARLFIAQ